MRYALIMAGGAGTRLWPMSREDRPKQLLPLIGGRSLLELSADRLDGLVDPERWWIATGEKFREPIRRTLPAVADERIIGEPAVRDTLPAMGLASAIVAERDPEAVVAVFTADHLIEPVETFQQRVETGFRIAEAHEDALVTFGIEPTHAATGYGYVELGEPLEGFDGAHRTAAFKEKPDAETARGYVESGRFLWNSGMFVWRASALLECIRRYEPQVHAGLREIAEAWGSDRQAEVLERVYPQMKKISIDFAVMEPASQDENVRVCTVTMPVRWLDVGGWPAYAETQEPDASGNRIAAAKGVAEDTQNTLIVSDRPDHVVAALGVRDLVIVHTDRATLVCHKDAAQQIKQLRQRVRETFGDDYV